MAAGEEVGCSLLPRELPRFANDQMALGMRQVARQIGLQTPDGIGIAGFDDIPESAFFSPTLTAVQQAQPGVRKLAIEEIIKTIESGWRESKRRR